MFRLLCFPCSCVNTTWEAAAVDSRMVTCAGDPDEVLECGLLPGTVLAVAALREGSQQMEAFSLSVPLSLSVALCL